MPQWPRVSSVYACCYSQPWRCSLWKHKLKSSSDVSIYASKRWQQFRLWQLPMSFIDSSIVCYFPSVFSIHESRDNNIESVESIQIRFHRVFYCIARSPHLTAILLCLRATFQLRERYFSVYGDWRMDRFIAHTKISSFRIIFKSLLKTHLT